ncbi:hypothetical protein [Leuconostoc mesenteroides]|uniref:hypothetical protein n=1 Tax=Leuconostoc mesenteroides TaxID=1245 RepID=UPI003991FBA9
MGATYTGLAQTAIKTLNSGVSQLNDGTKKLLIGENQASEALHQAGTGATTLANKLADDPVKLSATHNKKSNM